MLAKFNFCDEEKKRNLNMRTYYRADTHNTDGKLLGFSLLRVYYASKIAISSVQARSSTSSHFPRHSSSSPIVFATRLRVFLILTRRRVQRLLARSPT